MAIKMERVFVAFAYNLSVYHMKKFLLCFDTVGLAKGRKDTSELFTRLRHYISFIRTYFL